MQQIFSGSKRLNSACSSITAFTASLVKANETDFNSVDSPSSRDLIGELAKACNKEGLGLFLYYSYAADWKHPYFYSREAGIWFDPIMGFYSNLDLFPIEETYALIRSLSPHALISFKQGANGDEDFTAPERGGGAKVGEKFPIAMKVYELNKDKPKEICNTMQPHLPGISGATWGYNKAIDNHHLKVEDVKKLLGDAKENNCSLLLNIGPMPDGSVHPEDVATLSNMKIL